MRVRMGIGFWTATCHTLDTTWTHCGGNFSKVNYYQKTIMDTNGGIKSHQRFE